MAATAESQAVLTELQTPTVITPDAAKAAIKTAAPTIAKLSQECAIIMGLLQVAELTETNALVSGHFEGLSQAVAALQSQNQKLNATLRGIVSALDSLASETAAYATDVAAA